MMTTRRGFTLVELLIAMVLLAVVGAATYTMLINTQRLSRRQVEESSLQDNLRAGALILPAELREIGYDAVTNSDLLDIGVDFIRFRAMRGVGFTCLLAGTEMRIRTPVLGVTPKLKVGDTFLHFVEDGKFAAVDDQWIPVTIVNIENSTCPGDNGPALKFTVVDATAGGKAVVGGPVRFYDVMKMGLYTSDGKSWLGAFSSSAGELSYQPVLGPLRDGDGVVFSYRDATDVVTGDRDKVRTIEITLNGRSDGPVWLGTGGQKIKDLNLTTRVALRNTLRP